MRKVLRAFRIIVILCGLADPWANGAEVAWRSEATEASLPMTVLSPTSAAPDSAGAPCVVYLEGLAVPRVGTEGDETIIADFRREGLVVVVIDYQGHARAKPPFIHLDIAALRTAFACDTLRLEQKVDASQIYIVPSGHRLRRGLTYYQEGGRMLRMDVVYPSRPNQPVGSVLEFSCDNKDRMGNASLVACSDTLLEGFATAGYAVAMADHPVAAPYKGLDPMPDSALKIKAAVRTLRAMAPEIGATGEIVPVGFSRGSGMALMLVTTAGRPELDGAGEHVGVSSDVQGAIVMSGRFTYLDLLPGDRMIPRYEQAWGTKDAALERWRQQGPLDYLQAAPRVPVFLTINVTEGAEALHQMQVLRHRLGELGAETTYRLDRNPRGHKVTLDLDILTAMHAYLAERFHQNP